MAYLRLTTVANRVPFALHSLTKDPLLVLIQAGAQHREGPIPGRARWKQHGSTSHCGANPGQGTGVGGGVGWCFQLSMRDK